MRQGKKLATLEWFPKDFRCGKTWAKRFRFSLFTRGDKYLPSRLKPYAEWLKKELHKNEPVNNADARAQCTELFGAPKSQKAWSRFSSRMRNRFSVKSAKVKGSDGKWKYFWEKKKQNA